MSKYGYNFVFPNKIMSQSRKSVKSELPEKQKICFYFFFPSVATFQCEKSELLTLETNFNFKIKHGYHKKNRKRF